MLRKVNKLTTSEINNIFTSKDTPIFIERGVFFDIKYSFRAREKNKVFLKAAVVVSQKVFKRAVDRNKIRRQIYSILEKYRKENKLQEILKDKTLFFIFYLKKTITKLEFYVLEKEVYNSLNNIIKK